MVGITKVLATPQLMAVVFREAAALFPAIHATVSLIPVAVAVAVAPVAVESLL